MRVLYSHLREYRQILLRNIFPYVSQPFEGIHSGANTYRACVRTHASTGKTSWQLFMYWFCASRQGRPLGQDSLVDSPSLGAETLRAVDEESADVHTKKFGHAWLRGGWRNFQGKACRGQFQRRCSVHWLFFWNPPNNLGNPDHWSSCVRARPSEDTQITSDFKSNPLAIRNRSDSNHRDLSCDFYPLFHRF